MHAVYDVSYRTREDAAVHYSGTTRLVRRSHADTCERFEHDNPELVITMIEQLTDLQDD